ncbi:MAG: substrate-binding domain-containing protein [Opitutaceae bacterium]|nr:substrate-binding domain-containing protein [Opitutaceae bacterium]
MKPLVFAIFSLLISFGVISCKPSGAGALPVYQPEHVVSGEIRICGSPADGALLKDWENGFKKFHPAVSFSDKLYGPESTLAGLYTGVADLAFMARELRVPMEAMGYEWALRYKPTSVEIANAGLRTQRIGACLAVFVHRNNPLTQMTLTQLDAILGAEHRRGKANIRTWGELGLTGEWKDRPIHVYGPAVNSVPALFMRTKVLMNTRKWNPDYKEFPFAARPDTPDIPDAQILSALAQDPAGIAYATLRSDTSAVKMLALAEQEAGPFYSLTEETVRERTYPLARSLSMFMNRPPKQPVDPKVKEFLRYILSREGQEAIARDGAYLTLSAATAQAQLQRLE